MQLIKTVETVDFSWNIIVISAQDVIWEFVILVDIIEDTFSD